MSLGEKSGFSQTPQPFSTDGFTDVESALKVLTASAQSGTGILRLLGTGDEVPNAAEVQALALITADTETELGAELATLFNAYLGTSFASDDTLDTVGTAITALSA